MSDEALRNSYLQPRLKSLYGERSFSNLASKILNKFSASPMCYSLKIGFANDQLEHFLRNLGNKFVIDNKKI